MIGAFNPYTGFLGGIIIGLVAACYLYLHGRLCGVSGMTSDLATMHPNLSFSGFFLLGLFLGGLALRFAYPIALQFESPLPWPGMILAGLLVGVGTRISGGCTSGHGVCGVGRFSPPSIFATVVFIIVGMITATIVFHFFVGDPRP